MRKKTNLFLDKYLFAEELSQEQRIFNLVMILGVIAEFLVLISKILEGSVIWTILTVAGIIVFTALAFFFGNRTLNQKRRSRVPLILVCDLLFPLVFFTNGGITGGIACYFVLCNVLSFIMYRGKTCFILILIHIIVMLGCYVTEVLYPSLVVPLSSNFVEHVDVVLSILVAGLLSGIIIKFQSGIYEREKEKAEAATRAKADFLANVSHEIRTPLNAIIGLGELELVKSLPTETLVNLEKIHNAGMSLLGIINDLLDISKIESGNFELIPGDYHTASFINDTISVNMVRLGSKPIAFKLVIDENLPQILNGDELRLRQILNNLLSNAFKYTSEGTVWLRVLCEPIAEEARFDGALTFQSGKNKKIQLICTVEDTGIGIRQGDLDKLFSAYNQVNTKAARTIEGIGLGLSITKELANLMGGTISVKSEYGKGSTFTVVIPQTISDPVPIGKDTAEKLAKFRFYAEKRRRRGSVYTLMPYARVLVVDDVSTNLDVAKGMMMPYGLTIDCAASGKEAIRKISERKESYDLVFMDHMMPEMDGIETVRRIRNEIPGDYARAVPIIALTANAIIGNEKLFLDNGFQDYLSKPIDMSKLNVILQKWVRNREKEISPEWAPVIERMRIEETIDSNAEAAKEQKSLPLQAGMAAASPIPGIDFAGGVKRMGGREAAYVRILSSFAAGMPALLEKVRAFEPSRLSDYRITVHGIKGSSYGICADNIGKQAEALEMAAKSGDIEAIIAKNDGFILNMEELIREISKYITSL